jgi:hypothetical protein
VTDTHYCPRCQRELPLDSFGRRVVEGREYPLAYCRECSRAEARARYAAKRGGLRRHADNDAGWRARDEERARREHERLASITACPKCGSAVLARRPIRNREANGIEISCLCGWSDLALTTPRGRATSSVA